MKLTSGLHTASIPVLHNSIETASLLFFTKLATSAILKPNTSSLFTFYLYLHRNKKSIIYILITSWLHYY